MHLFTGLQLLCVFIIVAPLFITFCQMFRSRRTHQCVYLCWCSIFTTLKHGQVELSCCTGPRAMVLSLWRRDRNRIDSEEYGDTWWYRTPSFFMTMQTVTPLMSRTSCTAGSGRFWNIHRTHTIWVHAITFSSTKWKNYCEGPGTTQEMNLSVL